MLGSVAGIRFLFEVHTFSCSWWLGSLVKLGTHTGHRRRIICMIIRYHLARPYPVAGVLWLSAVAQ